MNGTRKRPPGAAARDKRMRLAVKLRAEGKTLRAIAVELKVSHQTVSNDLARSDKRQMEAAVRRSVRERLRNLPPALVPRNEIEAAADEAYEANPGKPLTPALAEQMRRLVGPPRTEGRQAA